MLNAVAGRFVSAVFTEAAPDSPQYSTFVLGPSRVHLDRIRQWVEAGVVKVHIERQFSFTNDGLHDMYMHCKKGRTRGKTVMRIAAD